MTPVIDARYAVVSRARSAGETEAGKLLIGPQ
jgi:hypothetical protein